MKSIKTFENYNSDIDLDFFKYIKGWQLDVWISKVFRYKKILLNKLKIFSLEK